MVAETRAANCDRFFGTSGPPAFLSQLPKSNRRRVRLDPASEFFDACAHAVRYGITVTVFDALAVRPALSVTVKVITLVPVAVY